MFDYKEIINFWFSEISSKDWWQKSDAFDDLLKKRYLEVHTKAVAGELSAWREKAEGRLAEILVLDQFSRNMYRDSAKAFTSDPLALCLAQMAIEREDDKKLNQQQRQFLYMPFMHSESSLIHKQAVELYASLDKGFGYDFELKHKTIIDRFARYPHRNAILGRQSTAEEIEFLQGPNSSF